MSRIVATKETVKTLIDSMASCLVKLRRSIYELHLPEGRVVMLQIPAAPKGIPIAFDGHYYGRDGEELSPLNLEELERIRAQAVSEDWSAVIVPDATIDDLDGEAIAKHGKTIKISFLKKPKKLTL